MKKNFFNKIKIFMIYLVEFFINFVNEITL